MRTPLGVQALACPLRRLVAPACWAAFALVCYGPLVGFLGELGQETAGPSGADLWARRLGLLWTSFYVAGVATLAAVILGAPVGALLSRLRVPGRRALLALCAAVLVVPPYVFGIAWLAAFGARGAWIAGAETALQPAWDPYQAWTAALVLAWAYFPLVVLCTWASLRAIPPEREAEALLHTGPIRTLWFVSLREARDGVLLGAGLVFLLAWTDFTVPDLFRTRVYAAEVFTEFSAFYGLGPASRSLAPLVLGAALVLCAFVVREDRAAFRQAGGRASAPPLPLWGAARWLAAGAWLVVLGLLLLPVVILFQRALPLEDFGLAWKAAGPELRQTLTTSFYAAALAGLLGYGCAVLIVPHPWRRRRWLEGLTLLPLFVPAPAVGIGLIRLWNRHGGMGEVYQSEAILVLAACARFLPLAVLAWARGLARVPRALYDAGRLDGLSGWAWQRHVALPAAWRHGLAGMALVFAWSVGELGASLLVAPPGASTLSIRIFTLLHYGADRMVAALCVLVVASIALPGFLAALALVGRRRFSLSR
ncbi:iron ABC transporter permease [bacterium]|nr:iron ABC transporter permease [bacterium]